ncbi:MAG: nucleoside-diphosphate sugar epimerase/dehydratase [Rhodocyclaceae bacterium]|nr:nucleoside-diphosphate sugar epimerase/dehydratase [Rhodocyclaceae bacterium]
MKLRVTLVFLHDLVVSAAAWTGAYWLRFNFDIPPDFLAVMLSSLPIAVLVQGGVFYALGLYRGMWRFASISDLKRILMAGGISALAGPAALAVLQYPYNIPRSVLVLDPLLLVLLMGGSRFAYRAWKDGQLLFGRKSSGEPVLILGAGNAAVTLLRDLVHNRSWRVVGLLDDSLEKRGRLLNGVRILGGLDAVAEQALATGARHAIIAMPSASAAQRRRAAELATEAGLSVLTVPAYDDILSGRVAISQVRKVEVEDLLGREQVQIDDEGLHRLLTDKVVLVTGAGGSIGSELSRQIMRFSPRLLVFFERSEFALYGMEQEFAGQPVACVVGDVKDAARLGAIFAQYRPEVVFHAAAYKHVPMMENENAWEAVRNNVAGTLCVARAAMENGVGEFVFISTDKAVNPTNVMGASKRLAEMVCQAVQAQKSETRFVMVRFGNVLGSSGSVIPKFREQIARGGPVTVTHPDIIRYFMLIPEASQLVLQAGLMGKGGEIFVLDMGEPIKIAELARDMIRLSGFTEDDIRIEYTGLRPGEKLYEELLADGEATMPTPHHKLRVAKPEAVPDEEWLAALDVWLAAPLRDEAEVKNALRKLVPEYCPATH